MIKFFPTLKEHHMGLLAGTIIRADAKARYLYSSLVCLGLLRNEKVISLVKVPFGKTHIFFLYGGSIQQAHRTN